jgi:MYXO-CTERM domain-containing protein
MLRSSRLVRLVPLTSLALAVLTTGGVAGAQEECPLGSTQKSESGQTWCEPTVCDQDNQCATGSVCRPVALCVEIGALDQAPGVKTDAGQRLLVRQRCGADKSCPQKTTCSDKGRCITRAQAEKAGLTSATSGTDAGAASSAPATDASKKSCGCHVPGAPGGELGFGGATLALLGLVAIGARRRRQGMQQPTPTPTPHE